MSIKKRDLNNLYVATVTVLAAFTTAFSYHVFILQNSFVPGGVSGLAIIVGYLLKLNSGIFILLFNFPTLVLVFLKVDKRTAIVVFFYIGLQSGILIIFEKAKLFYYSGGNILIYAIAGGVLTGIGFSLMFRIVGSSGGTYAIGLVLQKKFPAINIIWLSFIMDTFVILLCFFIYGNMIESIVCSIVNLFILNKVTDVMVQGVRVGYKYEMITSDAESLSKEIIDTLHTTVTKMSVCGMYSHESKEMLVCIVKKRQIGDFKKLLKKYPQTVIFVSKINEQYGGRS